MGNCWSCKRGSNDGVVPEEYIPAIVTSQTRSQAQLFGNIQTAEPVLRLPSLPNSGRVITNIVATNTDVAETAEVSSPSGFKNTYLTRSSLQNHDAATTAGGGMALAMPVASDDEGSHVSAEMATSAVVDVEITAAALLEEINRDNATQRLRYETRRFLSKLHKFLQCRVQMDSCYLEVDEKSELALFQLEDDSGGIQTDNSDSFEYKEEYRQQTVRGTPVSTIQELYEARK